MPQRTLQAKLFFIAATEIRVGRGTSCRYGRSRRNPAVIRKSGLEIKNRCTKEGENGEKLASILKSGLKIKNRCTQKVVFGEILASIPKFGPEIKNRCKPGLRRRNHFPLPQRKLVSDAERRCNAA
ncbi:MAG: hypothetical protein SOV31_06905 [Candidatus Cryptobacteroides sp.]|nr:hypothetical protein [Candidatus Cryptobacteroides sp.]